MSPPRELHYIINKRFFNLMLSMESNTSAITLPFSILIRLCSLFPLVPQTLSPTVAFLRNASNRGSTVPPTSFPGGLQPARSTASDRRVSRTDMDFEQALRAEGTVRLAELDVNSLGVDTSPLPTPRDFASPTPPSKETRTPRHQPPTPVIVPPTPSPGPSQSARMGAVSPASSSNDVFYDAEDTDIQTKRRSMYRSPGTSSSPDLATLLRKAKERGGTIGTQYKKEKRPEQPPPPLPESGLRGADRPPNGNRPRSSTSGTPYQPPPAPSPSMQTIRVNPSGGMRNADSGQTDDWVFTSPRSRKPSKDVGDPKVSRVVQGLIVI